MTLALVHGHVFVMAVIMPLVLGAALLMAHQAGGREVGPIGPGLAGAGLPAVRRGHHGLLQLVKGYHVLLAVRHGADRPGGGGRRLPGRAARRPAHGRVRIRSTRAWASPWACSWWPCGAACGRAASA